MSTLIPKLDRFAPVFNQFTNDYDVHFCSLDEIEDVVSFLDTYWKKGHVLVKSRKLLDWQHLDKVNNRYNFVIARNKQTSEIHALMGFIPTSFFDSSIKRVLAWGAIWKIREDVAPAGLGIYLWQFLTSNIQFESWVSFGISEDAKKNNKLMGLKICSSDNYFFVNPSIKEFKIAYGVECYQNRKYENAESYSLHELSLNEYDAISETDSCFDAVRLYKSKIYYVNRFFKHPYYKYNCYAIKQNEEVKSLFFMRESPANGGKCLRLVEYVGDYAYLQFVKASVSELLVKGNYEFIDIITSNIDDKIFENAGFINKSIDKNVIIPNYFEPFLQKNVPMEYSYISVNPDFKPVINKGDSDQDRPSVVQD